MVEFAAYDRHDRHDGKNNNGQRHVDRAQDEEGYDDLQPGDKEFLRAVVGKFGHIEQVAGDACHQLADLGVCKIAERQLLQMAEQRRAHIGFDFCAHHVADVRHEVGGGHIDQPQNEVQRRHTQHQTHTQAGHIIHADLRQIAHHHRQADLAQGGQGGADQVEQQHARIGAEIGGKAPHQGAGRVLQRNSFLS